MGKWHKYPKEAPKKAGIYLTVTMDPDSKEECYPSTCDYYKRGDVITYLHPIGDTAEERLMNILCDESRCIRADQDGFYDVQDDECWLVEPTAWKKLPKPPKGLRYMQFGFDV